jgi:hypothetical protein
MVKNIPNKRYFLLIFVSTSHSPKKRAWYLQESESGKVTPEAATQTQASKANTADGDMLPADETKQVPGHIYTNQPRAVQMQKLVCLLYFQLQLNAF